MKFDIIEGHINLRCLLHNNMTNQTTSFDHLALNNQQYETKEQKEDFNDLISEVNVELDISEEVLFEYFHTEGEISSLILFTGFVFFIFWNTI
jgi:hypothetical protein